MTEGLPFSSVRPETSKPGVPGMLTWTVDETAFDALAYSVENSMRWPESLARSAGFRFRAPMASLGSATPAPPMALLTAPMPWSWAPSPAQAGGERREARTIDDRRRRLGL